MAGKRLGAFSATLVSTVPNAAQQNLSASQMHKKSAAVEPSNQPLELFTAKTAQRYRRCFSISSGAELTSGLLATMASARSKMASSSSTETLAAWHALSRDSVEGQRGRPFLEIRFDFLKAQALNPAATASPEMDRDARVASMSMVAQTPAWESLDMSLAVTFSLSVG